MVTNTLEPLARMEARNRGLPDLRLVLVPHPLGGISVDEVLRRAQAAVPEVVTALVKGNEGP